MDIEPGLSNLDSGQAEKRIGQTVFRDMVALGLKHGNIGDGEEATARKDVNSSIWGWVNGENEIGDGELGHIGFTLYDGTQYNRTTYRFTADGRVLTSHVNHRRLVLEKPETEGQVEPKELSDLDKKIKILTGLSKEEVAAASKAHTAAYVKTLTARNGYAPEISIRKATGDIT